MKAIYDAHTDTLTLLELRGKWFEQNTEFGAARH